MSLSKSVLMSAVLLTGMTLAVEADAQYPAYPYTAAVQRTPPSWSYDPYTSGLGPCPQRFRGDPQCRYTVDPTYGQPDYWPAH